MPPFVTIGVPTYNRHDLLRETLNSILGQSFTDFEVIVGNDYTSDVLTGKALGITDPRIRFVNHPQNLREVGNMNALMGLASGRYFTWLFDDDLYEPDFLQVAHDALEANGFPPAFFSSYRILRGAEAFHPRQIRAGVPHLLTGREFLSSYSAGKPEIISSCGLFDTAAFRAVVGGVEELCSSAIGLYCEYLLLVRCALLGRIAFSDAPYVVFRSHAASWGISNAEIQKYVVAGPALIRRCAEVLRRPELAEEYSSNLAKICEIHLTTFASKVAWLEVTQGRLGIAGIRSALSRLAAEQARILDLFEKLGGGRGIKTSLLLGPVRIKGYLLVTGMLLVNRLRRMRW
jgi:glycosyltransferase involved in cell wall biosynthesis